ncbi:MAG TPA: TolC family protein [Terracidiphilus sp.]
MKFLIYAILGATLCAPVRLAYAQSDGLGTLAALFATQAVSTPDTPALTLDEAERMALERNPEIAVAARKLDTVQAHKPLAGALEDPMAMVRIWGVPFTQPGNLNAAQNMFGISQALPGAGKRPLEASMARTDVEIAQARLEQVRLAVRVRVRRAFNDMLLAQEKTRIHDQHVALARQAIEAARIKYAVGKVSQQDILKAQVKLTGLAEHMIHFDQDEEMARARLNTLLGRSPEAETRVLGELTDPAALPGLMQLEQSALEARPDLKAAAQMIERSRKEQALARKSMTPDFTVSGGYMLMPSGQAMRNSYMLEGTMSLPWLNRGRHNAEVAEATAKVSEQDAELDAMRNMAFGEIQETLVAARGAQKLAAMYQEHLRPQAEATLESSVVAYENEKTDFLDLLDSQMEVINIDLAWLQAMGEFNDRLADLELATGTVIDTTAHTAQEVKP